VIIIPKPGAILGHERGRDWLRDRSQPGDFAIQRGQSLGREVIGPEHCAGRIENAIAMAGGKDHSLALVGIANPGPFVPPASPTWRTGEFRISIATQRGRNYWLEWTDTLPATNQNWKLGSPMPEDGTTKTLSDVNASVPRRYYRARQW
jgi:hypothetical protein